LGEVIAKIMTGEPAIFDLRIVGRSVKVDGRSACAARIAACTSRAASSALRDTSNTIWMLTEPN